MTSIFFLALCSTADRVTVDFNALPAGQAMAKISKGVGLELRVEARLAREVVMVVAKDVPRDALMSQVAHVLRARWEKDPKGYVLRRPAEVQRALEKEAFERRVARFSALCERNRKFLQGLSAPDRRAGEVIQSLRDMVEKERTGRQEIVNGVYEPKYLTATNILLRQTLDALGPRELARVSDTAVYTPMPTRAQRRLEMATFLDEYRRTQERLATESREIPGLSPYIAGVVFNPVRQPHQIGKNLFRTYVLGGTLWASLRVYGTDGNAIDSADLREQFDEGIALNGRTERPALKKALATPGRDAPLSALSAAILAQFPSDPDAYLVSADIKPKAIPPEVLDAVLNPDKIDPLGFAASDALRGLAEGKSIVACLPDSLVRYAHIASSGTNVQLGAFEATARDLGDIEFKREGDWFQVRSADPLRDEGLRLPRAALGDLLREAFRKREMTVRDFAIYKHLANGIDVSSTIDHLYANLAAQAGAPPPFRHYQVPGGLWRLLGALPDPQWNALMEGQTITVGRLVEARRRVPEWARFTGERTPDEYGAQASDLWLDVTECVPTGIPNEATLRLGAESREVLQRLDSPHPTEMDNYLGPQARPLSEVAVFLNEVALESKATDPFTLMQGRYRIGTQGTLRFTLHLARGVQVTSAFELRPKVAESPGVPWAELPESYRNEVDRHLKDLAKKRATEGASGTIPFK